MNNYSNSNPIVYKLPTNRSFSTIFLRGLISFAILYIIDVLAMRRDLTIITKPYTSKRANFLFYGRKTYKLINFELERRGINYRIKDGMFCGFSNYSKAIIALNLLCQDYNSRGC